MPSRIPLVICALLFLSSILRAEDPIMELEKCKGTTNESVCVGRIIVDYLQKNLGGQSQGNIYCKCLAQGVGVEKVTLVRMVPNCLPETIGNHLDPRDCITALRFHPCMGSSVE